MGIVVGLDAGEEFDPGVGAVDKAAVLQHLRFQSADEGFGPGIMIGIGPGGHALADAGLLKELPVFAAAILAAAVAMKPTAQRLPAGRLARRGEAKPKQMSPAHRVWGVSGSGSSSRRLREGRFDRPSLVLGTKLRR